MADRVCTTAAEFVTALAAADPGDTLTLTAGNTFDTTTGFLLTNRGATASNPITIRTSQYATLPNRRIHPGDAARMPTIRATGVNERAIETSGSDADYWVLQGLHITATANQSGGLVIIGDFYETVAANQPVGVTLDRCYIHGTDALLVIRAVALHGSALTVQRCWIDQIWSDAGDNQAIWMLNGPGPYTITDNFLSAVGETLFAGGADPSISGCIPSDVTVRYNTITAPLAKNSHSVLYDGSSHPFKATMEIKTGRRMLFEYNLFENAWQSAQNGTCVLFSVRNQDGGNSSNTIEDVIFRYNVVRHAKMGIRFLSKDLDQVSDWIKRISITHNLITDIDCADAGAAGSGALVMFVQGGTPGAYHGADDITIEHNTFDAYTATAAPVIFDEGGVYDTDKKFNNFIYRNNIARFDAGNGFGLKYGGQTDGTPSLDHACNTYTVSNNVFFDGNPNLGNYPANNWEEATNANVGFRAYATQDYVLNAAGTLGDHRAGGNQAASDGTDVGANVALIKRHVFGRHGLGQGW